MQDIQLANGIVHVVDAVIEPPRITNTILDIVRESEAHIHLLDAIELAGLEDTYDNAAIGMDLKDETRLRVNLESQDQKEKMREILVGLYQCFKEKDATVVEINPLGVVQDGRILICDSKLKVDDNAQPRLKELFKKEDLS